MESFYSHMSANKWQSYFFVVVFFFFIVFLITVISFVMGYSVSIIVPLAVFLAIILTVGSYYYSDKIVLKISKARPANHNEHRFLDNTVEGLALAAGLPKPKLYIIDDSAPNAFATGRNPEKAVICVTTGLLKKLNRQELEGVLAHEMSHIRNYDIRLMMIVAVMVGISVLISDLFIRFLFYGGMRGRGNSSEKGGGLFIILLVIGVVLAILTPIIAQVIKLAISRKREFLADASAAQLTRYPKGLADALRKISADKEVLEAANKATAHMYIASPLKGQKMWMKSMFSTHPPVEKRIKALESM